MGEKWPSLQKILGVVDSSVVHSLLLQFLSHLSFLLTLTSLFVNFSLPSLALSLTPFDRRGQTAGQPFSLSCGAMATTVPFDSNLAHPDRYALVIQVVKLELLRMEALSQ